MTQPYRKGPSDRASSARPPLDPVRPAGESSSAADEPPVLLRLSDFSRPAPRRPTNRPYVKLPRTPSVPPPPPDEPPESYDSRELPAAYGADDQDSPYDSIPRTHRRTPGESIYSAPGSHLDRRLGTTPSTPSTIRLPESREASSHEGRAAGAAGGSSAVASPEAIRAAVESTGPSGAAKSPADADLVAKVAAPSTVGAKDEDASADESPSWMERVVGYRPSLPVLLGLVLATIVVAYIYRPQETPPKRRGSGDAVDPRRQFDDQFDRQRPQSAGERTNQDRSPPGEPAEPDVPTLDLPGDSESAPPDSSAGGVELRGPALTGPDAAEGSNRVTSGGKSPPTQLAGRPQPVEPRDAVDPPTMPESSPMGEEAPAEGEEEDDGPPPDIEGRTYPVTDPSTFYYRGTAPETREAARPNLTTGETR